jgi:hypothetical protein
MRQLEGAEDQERLEIWMVVIWKSLGYPTPVSMMEDIEWVTLKLVLQQASALQRFKDLCAQQSLNSSSQSKIQQICNQAEELLKESLAELSLYVSVCSTHYLLF